MGGSSPTASGVASSGSAVVVDHEVEGLARVPLRALPLASVDEDECAAVFFGNCAGGPA